MRVLQIRAEMKLRTHLKSQEATSLESSDGNDAVVGGGEISDASALVGKQTNNDAKTKKLTNRATQPKHNLLLHCIGTIVSPYTK